MYQYDQDQEIFRPSPHRKSIPPLVVCKDDREYPREAIFNLETGQLVAGPFHATYTAHLFISDAPRDKGCICVSTSHFFNGSDGTCWITDYRPKRAG